MTTNMSPTSGTRIASGLLSVLLLAAPLAAQTTGAPPAAAAGLSGHWEGSIQAPGAQVAVEIDLIRNREGALAGQISIPGQNLKGLALTNVAVAGTLVGFQLGNTPGDRTFDGTLSADSRSIAGTFTQRSFEMPFTLARTGDARVEARAANGPIARELEGKWQASAEVNGTTMQWVLTLANDADGSARGAVLNVTEGLEIPIGRITQNAPTVTLDFPAVGGAYTGTVSADGTQLTGTFTQGPGGLELTFRRTAGAQ